RSVRRSLFRARGSASTSAHHSSLLGSRGCHPGPALDCITGLHHGRHQPRYIEQGRIEQDEIRWHDRFWALLIAWFFNFNAHVANEPLEALLVPVLLLPARKVSDVALTTEQASPTFRGLHHDIIQPHRE